MAHSRTLIFLEGGRLMKILAHYIGTVRQFRSWLRQQKCQVVDLAEYREKKKPAPRRTKEKLLSNIISRKGVEEK